MREAIDPLPSTPRFVDHVHVAVAVAADDLYVVLLKAKLCLNVGLFCGARDAMSAASHEGCLAHIEVNHHVLIWKSCDNESKLGSINQTRIGKNSCN